MSRATTSPVTEPAGTMPAAGDGLPLTADELVRRGVVMGGRVVSRLTVDFVSGQVTCELEPEPEHRADLKARIVRRLKDSPHPLTRKQLARALGLKDARGRFSQVVSTMVEHGEIFDVEGELTDDVTKSGDDTYS